jgi:hypothetical protein
VNYPFRDTSDARKGGEGPILEKRRREQDEKRSTELHFKWLEAVAVADRATGSWRFVSGANWPGLDVDGTAGIPAGIEG